MSTDTGVKIKPDIYLWAIEESGKSFEEVLDRFTQIESWISEEVFPSFKQIEELVNFLKVPLGYMFLQEAPVIKDLSPEFRTIHNKIPEMSKELKDTLYNIKLKQDWISEHRKEKGWESLDFPEKLEIERNNIIEISKEAKKYLNISSYWYKDFTDPGSAFNYLREALENKGIIVMQNSVVASNNHRSLNLDEFRGFLLYDSLAPIIFINNIDTNRGKIFTLIHEYIHFLLKESDILINEDIQSIDRKEQIINNITAEFLIPRKYIKNYWKKGGNFKEQIESFSKELHASQLSIAIKLRSMKLIKQEDVDKIKKNTENYVRYKGERESTGGNYYNTFRFRMGDSFIKTIIQGAEAGDISYTQAFRLLDNSVKAYDYFKGEYMKYDSC